MHNLPKTLDWLMRRVCLSGSVCDEGVEIYADEDLAEMRCEKEDRPLYVAVSSPARGVDKPEAF